MRQIMTLFVPGVPRPQGSKSPKGRTKTGRAIMVESSKYVKAWREGITGAARQCGQTFDGAVSVELLFVMPLPKAGKALGTQHTAKPDIDKLCRAVLDALTAAESIVDDSYVVSLSAEKIYAVPSLGYDAGVHIRIECAPRNPFVT